MFLWGIIVRGSKSELCFLTITLHYTRYQKLIINDIKKIVKFYIKREGFHCKNVTKSVNFFLNVFRFIIVVFFVRRTIPAVYSATRFIG